MPATGAAQPKAQSDADADLLVLGPWGEGYVSSLASARRVVDRLDRQGITMNVDVQLNDGHAGPVKRVTGTPWSHLVGTNQGDCLKTGHIEPAGKGLPRHLLGDLARSRRAERIAPAPQSRRRRGGFDRPPGGRCDDTPTIESGAELEASVRRMRARRHCSQSACAMLQPLPATTRGTEVGPPRLPSPV